MLKFFFDFRAMRKDHRNVQDLARTNVVFASVIHLILVEIANAILKTPMVIKIFMLVVDLIISLLLIVLVEVAAFAGFANVNPEQIHLRCD